MKSKYKLEKVSNALFKDGITQKQFNNYYEKESKKQIKFSSEIGRIYISIMDRKLNNIEVKFYKK